MDQLMSNPVGILQHVPSCAVCESDIIYRRSFGWQSLQYAQMRLTIDRRAILGNVNGGKYLGKCQV